MSVMSGSDSPEDRWGQEVGQYTRVGALCRSGDRPFQEPDLLDLISRPRRVQDQSQRFADRGRG